MNGWRRNKPPVIAISRIGFFACAAALLYLSPSLARGEEKKPVLYVKTSYVEIEVSIAKELRSYPQLYSTLLADAKKYAEQNRKEAHAAWQTDRLLFRDHSQRGIYRRRPSQQPERYALRRPWVRVGDDVSFLPLRGRSLCRGTLHR